MKGGGIRPNGAGGPSSRFGRPVGPGGVREGWGGHSGGWGQPWGVQEGAREGLGRVEASVMGMEGGN